MSNYDAAEIAAFVNGLELPGTSPFEGHMLPELPEYHAGVDQVVTVGSQLAEFERSFPAELRPHAANSFLLAQLAADKYLADHGGNSTNWYNLYTTVLGRIGWNIESRDSSLKVVNAASLRVHQQLIPLLVSALGPAAAASSLIIDVLKGLENIDKNQPWMALFDQESQRAAANQFQISYGSVDPDGVPRLRLSGFELDAGAGVTQVLFFKLSTATATLRQFSIDVSANGPIIESIAPVVASRIEAYVASYVMSVKI